jgi:hypothetical protein
LLIDIVIAICTHCFSLLHQSGVTHHSIAILSTSKAHHSKLTRPSSTPLIYRLDLILQRIFNSIPFHSILVFFPCLFIHPVIEEIARVNSWVSPWRFCYPIQFNVVNLTMA